MTDSEPPDRFMIELGTGTANHIIEMHTERTDDTSFLSSHRMLPGEVMCSRGNRWPENECVTPSEYAARQVIDEFEFDGDAPEEICSYCWSNTIERIGRSDQDAPEGIHDQLGTVGYRLPWKQKGRAREEWYDIVVRPETTMAELDTLVCRFTTLDDFHLRMYGLEDEYLDSMLNVLPDHQFEEAGDPSYTKASEVTIADVADRASLWDGDRLSMVYDFGTPSRYFCIVKEVYDPDEIETLLDDREPITATETVAIIDEKRP